MINLDCNSSIIFICEDFVTGIIEYGEMADSRQICHLSFHEITEEFFVLTYKLLRQPLIC